MDNKPNTDAERPKDLAVSLSFKDYKDDMDFEINKSIVSLGKTGVVATRDISRGEALFYDRALCYVDPVLCNDPDGIVAVEKWLYHFPRKEIKRLNRLCEKDLSFIPTPHLVGHLQSLALTMDLPVLEDRLIEAWPKVLTARRKTTKFCRPILSWATLAFPHSCSPNATVLPVPFVGKRVEFYVVATKPIAKGESVMIDHSNIFPNRGHTEVLDHGVRNRNVQGHESFCTLCMKNLPWVVMSEKVRIMESMVRRNVMQKIGMRISEPAVNTTNGGDLRRGWMFREALAFADLLRIDGIADLKISFAYFAAALYAGREGDTLRARELVRHGVHQAAQLLATDHTVFRDYELFGFDKNWDPNAEALWKGVLGTLTRAQGDGSLDLEWMLDTSGNFNSLRENATFPTFKLLNRYDQAFNQGIIDFLQGPNRHWFLLAEVDRSADYEGNTIVCHDKDHNRFEVSTVGFRSGKIRILRPGTVVMFLYQMSQPIQSGEGTTIGIAPVQPQRYEVSLPLDCSPTACLEFLLTVERTGLAGVVFSSAHGA